VILAYNGHFAFKRFVYGETTSNNDLFSIESFCL
jgi:hypothetical protein